MRNAYEIVVSEPEGRRSPRRPSRRKEYNTRMDLREIGWESMDWINLAHVRNT